MGIEVDPSRLNLQTLVEYHTNWLIGVKAIAGFYDTSTFPTDILRLLQLCWLLADDDQYEAHPCCCQ
jgi:hypothetical protein